MSQQDNIKRKRIGIVLMITLSTAIISAISDGLNISSIFWKKSKNVTEENYSTISKIKVDSIQLSNSLIEKGFSLNQTEYILFEPSGYVTIIGEDKTDREDTLLNIPFSFIDEFIFYKFERKLRISFKGNIPSSIFYCNRKFNRQAFYIYLEQLKSAGTVINIKTRFLTFLSISGVILILLSFFALHRGDGCLSCLILFIAGDYLLLVSTGNIPYLR